MLLILGCAVVLILVLVAAVLWLVRHEGGAAVMGGAETGAAAAGGGETGSAATSGSAAAGNAATSGDFTPEERAAIEKVQETSKPENIDNVLRPDSPGLPYRHHNKKTTDILDARIVVDDARRLRWVLASFLARHQPKAGETLVYIGGAAVAAVGAPVAKYILNFFCI
jgi:hypothetical protein